MLRIVCAGLNVEVLGKSQLGLEEIGEFSPDGLRAAFASLAMLRTPKSSL